MKAPPDLLLVTWNRREYVEKTLARLFADDAAFHLYCWDNNSRDGTADIIAALNDPRVVAKHFHAENVRQRAPWLWFIETARGDLVGKIDDDILLPHGWTSRIAPLLRRRADFGLLGCWIYMPEDWNEELAAHKIRDFDGTRVFQNAWLAGQSFLVRKDLTKRYVTPERPGSYGTPINQALMTRRGYITGYPLPLLLAHNMDDPRSPHCRMARTGIDAFAALSARARGFTTLEEYRAWIVADARAVLTATLGEQQKRYSPTLVQRLERKARRTLARLRRRPFPVS